MNHEEKIAVARIMSDIVKADGHLSIRQFEYASKLEEQYHFSPEEMSAARNITFSAALSLLKHLPRLDKKELLSNMKELAYADRYISSEEALLLTAMKYIFDGTATLVAFPTPDAQDKDVTMMYMETEPNDDYNDELDDKNTYRLISSICHLAGIRFACIPKIMKDFCAIDPKDIANIVRYMSPSLSDEEASNVARRMGELTTSEFYLKVMHMALSKTMTPPDAFLLVKMGISMTPYCKADGTVKYYKEYMCLPITDSVLKTVDTFVEEYTELLTIPPKPLPEDSNNYDFLFYKLFFDFLLTPPPVVPDLIFMGQDIRTAKYHIAFRFGSNEKRINLTPKEYDAFYAIVEKHFHAKAKGLTVGFDRANLAPIISHIRQKITAEIPEIALAERFKPERSGNSYTVKMEKDIKVFVRKHTSITEYEDVPM